MKKAEPHRIERPKDAIPEPLPDEARVALFGDWGTGMYGAPVIAETISADGAFDVVMHLGDVYYAGTEKEMRARFLDVWPKLDDAVTSRALNSNHEMYSGGYGYFDVALPACGQPSSYFALQNDYWTLIALDSAYVDHDLDDEQMRWVNEVIGNAGDRRIVLLSHHQLFSRLESQGPKLARHLATLLTTQRVFAWYWGHEHRCVVYDKHPACGLYGRCIGHGGIPERRKHMEDWPVVETIDEYMWRSLSARFGIPGSLILDGPNAFIPGKEEKYLPHGYATLEFKGSKLIEAFFSPDGKLLREADLT